MKKLSKTSKNYKKSTLGRIIQSKHFLIGVFILTVSFLSFISFHRVLDFAFWRDDWIFLWTVQHNSDVQLAWSLHPATIYEDFLLFKVFGWNSGMWQGFGIVLRIIASLSIALMMWGLTRSKKVAIVSGLLFSVSFVALETVSWRSVHVVMIVIILLSIGFYFLSQYIKYKNKKNYIFSLLFFCSSILADPARSFPVIIPIFLLLLGEFWIVKDYSFKKIKTLFIEFIPLLLAFVLILRLNSQQNNVNDLIFRIIQIIDDPSIIKNFFSSIGNLLFGWVFEIAEKGGQANYDYTIATSALLITLLLTVISFVHFVSKRSKTSLLIFIFSLWLVVFYFPNWIFDKSLVIGGTHRYLGVSGVGLIGLTAIAIGSVRGKFLFYGLALVALLLNIQTTKRILAVESTYRDQSVTNMVWDKIDRDVPKNQKDLIFMYLGGDYIRGAIMDWSASLPFGVRRGIAEIDDFPIPTADTKLILDLLCKDNVMRPSVSKWSLQKKRIPLSHLYAWDVTNGKITNVSLIQREIFKKMAEDSNCSLIQ